MRFRTQWNNHEIGQAPRRRYTMTGKTIPDQSLTIKQLLDRHRLGLPLMGNIKVPVYHGEDVELPDFDKMDLAEVEAYKNGLEARLTDLKAQYKQQYDQALKEKAEKRQKQESDWIKKNEARIKAALGLEKPMDEEPINP